MRGEKRKIGKSVFIASRRAVMCMIRKIQLLAQKEYNLNISVGEVLSLRRFFIKGATGKEKKYFVCENFALTQD